MLRQVAWEVISTSACRRHRGLESHALDHPSDCRLHLLGDLRPLFHPWHTDTMSFTGDEFDRLERMIYRPVSTRPDWLKAWRNEALYLLYLARRAVDADDEELVQELEEQARDMADVVEAKLRSDGLL